MEGWQCCCLRSCDMTVHRMLEVPVAHPNLVFNAIADMAQPGAQGGQYIKDHNGLLLSFMIYGDTSMYGLACSDAACSGLVGHKSAQTQISCPIVLQLPTLPLAPPSLPPPFPLQLHP